MISFVLLLCTPYGSKSSIVHGTSTWNVPIRLKYAVQQCGIGTVFATSGNEYCMCRWTGWICQYVGCKLSATWKEAYLKPTRTWNVTLHTINHQTINLWLIVCHPLLFITRTNKSQSPDSDTMTTWGRGEAGFPACTLVATPPSMGHHSPYLFGDCIRRSLTYVVDPKMTEVSWNRVWL